LANRKHTLNVRILEWDFIRCKESSILGESHGVVVREALDHFLDNHPQTGLINQLASLACEFDATHETARAEFIAQQNELRK
jgi:hypothetical protein